MVTSLTFENQEYYNFAVTFLNQAQTCGFQIQIDDTTLTVDIEQPTVKRLLTRMHHTGSVLLPYCGSKTDHWIIADIDKRRLDQTLARVSRFVIPSYAEFTGQSQTPQLRLFQPGKHDLQTIGAQLYPVGYYSWQSPVQYRNIILQRLGQWLDLEARQPTIRTEIAPNYHDLFQTFQLALTAGNWTEAESIHHKIQQFNLSTADNLEFLHIQLLARQQKWHELWELPTYATLTRLPLPRAVRIALLTAFHLTNLLPLEKVDNWMDAIETLNTARPKLGTLLTGRFDANQESVVRVFAYLAVLEKNHNHLAQLTDLTNNDETKRCLTALAELLPPPEPIAPIIDPLAQAQSAMFEADYDTALTAIKAVSNKFHRTRLLLQLAFQSNDFKVAEIAMDAYFSSLTTEEQNTLVAEQPNVSHYLSFLEDITAPPTKLENAPTITTWLSWFEYAKTNPDASCLAQSLQHLKQTTDDRNWNPETVSALAELIFDFAADANLLTRHLIKDAFSYLTSVFLSDDDFPREESAYQEIYQVLLWALLAHKKRNETYSTLILRLMYAILKAEPNHQSEILTELQKWFADPIPALESQVLDAFDLLAEYGVDPWALANWYRTWLSHLLNLPTSRDRASLEVWQAFAGWIQPGDDLQHRLEKALAVVTEQDTVNPVATLPVGYRLTIFTLCQSSSERAKQILLKRNPQLDIRLVFEKDLNTQVKSLAKNADMAIIVTTCISHALTYGIRPYLQTDPVYPVSSGSTSIIRAVESYLTAQSA